MIRFNSSLLQKLASKRIGINARKSNLCGYEETCGFWGLFSRGFSSLNKNTKRFLDYRDNHKLLIAKRVGLFMILSYTFPLTFISPKGVSMLPTISHDKDILVLDLWFFKLYSLVLSFLGNNDGKFDGLGVGDIVAFFEPLDDDDNNDIDKIIKDSASSSPMVPRPSIKRIISIRDYIPILSEEKNMSDPSYEVWVEGDNIPELTKDSRNYGFVKNDNIIGKVLFRVYPFQNFGHFQGKNKKEVLQMQKKLGMNCDTELERREFLQKRYGIGWNSNNNNSSTTDGDVKR